MLQFMFDNRRKKAKAILTSRLNKTTLMEMQGSDRECDRSSYARVIVVVPAHPRRGWNFDGAEVVVSRDLSASGVSFIRRRPLREEDRVLIALPDDDSYINYVNCKVQHCTDLGYNFYKVGVSAEEVVRLDHADSRRIEELLENNKSES